MPYSLCNLLHKHRQTQLQNRMLLQSEYITSEFVITEETGTCPRPDGISQFVRRRLKASDLPYIRLHEFQHTYASLLHCEGVEHKIAADTLGHSLIDFTQVIYVHAYEEDRRQAAEAMRKYIYI